VAPDDKGINLNDILEDGYSPKDKARCLLVSDSRPLTTPIKMFHRFYAKAFTTLIFRD
jgi:DNA (cytosine-5)-methyltransferase 3A